MFCTKCGYQIKDGYKFCPKCGTPVYIEKEEPKIEKEKEICEVVVEAKAEPGNTETPTTKVKSAKKAKSSLKAKKVNNDTMPQSKFISESLIAKELDIEDVVKKAENGDAEAMLRQAFRYEIGIGCVMNKEKAASLYEQIKDNKDFLPVEELSYKSIIGIEDIKI